ncbi:hypothetical protein GF373_10930 [bacterium]|nr:hypothetical protein [bacterium]
MQEIHTSPLQQWERRIGYIVLATTPFIITPLTFDSFLLPKYVWLSFWAALWFCLIALQASWKEYRKHPIDLPILAFLLITLISLLIHYRTNIQIRAFLRLLIFVGYFYAYRRFWAINGSKKAVGWILACVCILLSAYGILQDYGIDFTDKVGGVRDWRSKIVATLGNPNFLGGYLGIAIPTVLAFGLRRVASKPSILFAGLAALLTATCITLTFCVGVTIGFLVTIPVGLLFLWSTATKPNIPWPRFAVFLVLILLGIGWYMADNPYNRHGRSLYKEAMASPQWWSGMGAREFNWRTTRIMIDENPLSGIGFGNYLSVHIHYQGMNYAELENDAHDRANVVPVDQPHFQLLETAAESGPLGVFAMSWMVMVWLVCAIQTLRNEKSWFAWGSFLGVWVAIVHSFSSFPFHLPANALLVVALASYHVKDTKTIISEKTRIKPFPALLFILCAILVGVEAYFALEANRYLRKGVETPGPMAMYHLESSRSYDPYVFHTHFLLGSHYAAQGWNQKAIASLNRAIQLQEDMMAHRYLSRIYQRMGDLDAAIREQKRVVELNPIFPDHLRDLAELLRQDGQTGNADELEKRAKELDAIIEKKYP